MIERKTILSEDLQSLVQVEFQQQLKMSYPERGQRTANSQMIVLEYYQEHQLVAGLLAEKLYQTIHLKVLVVKENYRKQSIGKILMQTLD